MSKVDVIMPQMGESIAEGTLTRWLKSVGDAVERDEDLFEISTDKVDADIPSPTAGVLAEVLVQSGETVEVNTVVARIETDAAVAASTAPSTPAAPADRRGGGGTRDSRSAGGRTLGPTASGSNGGGARLPGSGDRGTTRRSPRTTTDSIDAPRAEGSPPSTVSTSARSPALRLRSCNPR